MKFPVLILVLGLAGPAFAASLPAVRVAIVSDANEKDLAAFVETELSADPSIALVERDDLGKIGDEATVQQMAGTDATALGKLLGAGGLSFWTMRTTRCMCALSRSGWVTRSSISNRRRRSNPANLRNRWHIKSRRLVPS